LRPSPGARSDVCRKANRLYVAHRVAGGTVGLTGAVVEAVQFEG
jgi:hypothetical protein